MNYKVGKMKKLVKKKYKKVGNKFWMVLYLEKRPKKEKWVSEGSRKKEFPPKTFIEVMLWMVE